MTHTHLLQAPVAAKAACPTFTAAPQPAPAPCHAVGQTGAWASLPEVLAPKARNGLRRWRLVVWMGAASVLLCACQSQPPVPDWQVNAQSASERFTQAQLVGHTRVAQSELALARRETASTGRIDLAARLELLACAVQVASVDFGECPEYAALAQDASAAEQAYAQHLAAVPLAADRIALLPAAQQAVAHHLTRHVGRPPQTAQGGVVAGRLPEKGAALALPATRSTHHADGSMHPNPVEKSRKEVDAGVGLGVSGIEDPLSRLVAAGVLLRAGLATPTVVAQAVDTASQQGWRRPLLAWLGVQAQWAQAAGAHAQAQAIRRRMQLVAPQMASPAHGDLTHRVHAPSPAASAPSPRPTEPQGTPTQEGAATQP